MILVFDTETTDMLNFKLPATDPSQPRLLQLAALLMDGEKTVASFVSLISVDVPISAKAFETHGISEEMSRRCGMDVALAIRVFRDLCWRSETVVAHNIDFDSAIIDGESARLGIPKFLYKRPWVCTMKSTTEVCAIPSQYKAGQFKRPSLAEAHLKLTGETFDGAHDAMADTMACSRIYQHLTKTQL